MLTRAAAIEEIAGRHFEVVVIDEEYGIRISEIVGSRPADANARR